MFINTELLKNRLKSYYEDQRYALKQRNNGFVSALQLAELRKEYKSALDTVNKVEDTVLLFECSPAFFRELRRSG